MDNNPSIYLPPLSREGSTQTAPVDAEFTLKSHSRWPSHGSISPHYVHAGKPGQSAQGCYLTGGSHVNCNESGRFFRLTHLRNNLFDHHLALTGRKKAWPWTDNPNPCLTLTPKLTLTRTSPTWVGGGAGQILWRCGASRDGGAVALWRRG